MYSIKSILALLMLTTLASCQTTATDTSLQGASDAQLHARMQTTCMSTQTSMSTQEKLTSGTYEQLWPACECYATTTLKALDTPEKDNLRSTGVFNDSAKDKALNSLDICKLKRP